MTSFKMGLGKFVKDKKKSVVINIILFAVLYLSVSFNKEIIRPVYGDSPILGIITGSFSNFMAAFIVSLFPIAPSIARKLDVKKCRLITYSFAICVFVLLTIEEVKPYVDASKVFDKYDIIASGLGSVIAILIFEVLAKKYIRQEKNPENK